MTAPSIGTPSGLAAAAPARPAMMEGDAPDFVRPEVKHFRKARRRCKDLMAGTDAIHAAAEEYLPKWPGEDPESYRARSTLTEVYGAFSRCVSAARGLVGAKPPQIEDSAPEQIQEHWADIDGEGTHGEVFAMRCFEDGIVNGPAFLLIDYVAVAPGAIANLEEAQQANIRPTWSVITADQVVNWRTAKIGGKTILTMVTIHEEVDDESGNFAVVCVEQYRTIRRGVADDGNGGKRNEITWTIWRKKETPTSDGVKVEWYIYDEGEYRGPKRIPLATGYLARKTGYMVAEPPLGALAELNIGHYRISADRRWLMSIVHAPTFVLEGWTEPVDASGTPTAQNPANAGEIKLGANAVLKTPPGCVAKWVQAEPNGLDSSKQEKDDVVAQMASMSIAFLAQQRKAQETATAHRINSIAQNATLATAARGLQDLLDEALQIHCEYLGIDAPPTSVVNTTYDEDQLDAPTITALNALANDMNITRKTLLLVLQRGNILPDDIDLEAEDAALTSQHQEAQDAQAAAANRAHALLAAVGGGNGKGGGKAPAAADPGVV